MKCPWVISAAEVERKGKEMALKNVLNKAQRKSNIGF
jgi:hypothetical protein